MKRKYILAICLALTSCICTTTKAGEAYNKLNMPKFIIGTCTHYGHGKGSISENISMIKQAGIMATRDELSWGALEKEKGKFSSSYKSKLFMKYNKEAFSQGLYPLQIFSYSNKHYNDGDYPRTPEAREGFARYCEYSLNLLKPYCRLYQVWNEWGYTVGMPKKFQGNNTADNYIKLLKTAYPRIKKAYPAAVVIANGVMKGDDFLEELMKLGMLNYCDVVDLHTYNYYTRGTPETWYDRIQRIDKMLRRYNNGQEVPMYITEMGWPTQTNTQGVTADTSADYLARMYILARTLPFLKGLWWYDFQNDGWQHANDENNFGMTKADLTPQPAYEVMADISSMVKSADFIKRHNVNDPNIWILQFKLQSGSDALAMWSSHPDNLWQVTLKNNSKELTPIMVRRVGSEAFKREWIAYECNDKGFHARNIPGSFNLSIGGRPWIIEGDLSMVSVTKVTKRTFPETKRIANSILVVPSQIGRATPAGAQPITYSFGGQKNFRRIASNLGFTEVSVNADFNIQYEKDKLLLEVNVTDDVFNQKSSGGTTWRGDGLQFGLKQLGLNEDSASTYTEIDCALTKAGPIAFKRGGSPGAKNEILKGLDLKISQNGKVTTYKIGMPINLINLSELKKGAVIAFSLVINDNDGKGRKGYLHWGNGIGDGKKDPLLFNWIVME